MRRLFGSLLRRVLTRELAEAIEGDLEEGYRRRTRVGPRWRAGVWVVWQLLTLRYVRLGRRARRVTRRNASPNGAHVSHSAHDRHTKEAVMRGALQDMRIAVRTFMRRPGFALLAIGTLALGIGAHAALFTAVDGVLLKPLDLPRSDELIIARMQVQGEDRFLTGPNALDVLREGDAVLASGAAFWGAAVTIIEPDGRRALHAAVGATPGVFETLGVPLQLGHPWGDEAVGTGAITAVVITDRLWRSRFGADSALVGSSLVVNGSAARVTGVLARGFEFPTQESADYIFAPLMDPATLPRAGLGGFTLLARLRPGASLEQARERLGATWEGLRAQHPADLLDYGFAVTGLHAYTVREVRPALLALIGATSLLVVLACANVANLMLARGIGRSAEMGIRASLGAGRGRLARQILVESGVLSAVAGLAAVVVAQAMLAVLRSAAPVGIADIADLRLDVRAAGVAVSLALVCGFIVALGPALRASRADHGGALRGGARTSDGHGLRRLQGALVVTQIATAVVLSIGAGLLVRSFSRLSNVDPGYRTQGVLTATLGLPEEVYADRTSRAAFYARIEEAVARLPDVRSVGTTLRAPFATGEIAAPVRLADVAETTLEDAPRVEVGIVSGGYLEALEIPIVRGRGFTTQDHAESPRVALLSASLARSLFGNEDPIGRRLAPVLGAWENSTNWAEVVGVVGDIRLERLDAAVTGTLYLATAQMPQPFGTLAVRAAGDPGQLVDPLRETLLRAEPKLLSPTVQTLESQRAESLAQPRFNSLLLGGFSILALTLAAVGIYGLLSYSVARRRLELGVRVAFGANRAAVLRLVLGEGLRLAGLGLAIGLIGALITSRTLSALLFGVAPSDPATYGAAAAGVAVLAIAGCFFPALRAARGDVLAAIRGD